MSKIKRLTDSYGQFISLPWRDDTAAAQRVIFCVYPETEELRLRANLDEFELVLRSCQPLSTATWIGLNSALCGS